MSCVFIYSRVCFCVGGSWRWVNKGVDILFPTPSKHRAHARIRFSNSNLWQETPCEADWLRWLSGSIRKERWYVLSDRQEICFPIMNCISATELMQNYRCRVVSEDGWAVTGGDLGDDWCDPRVESSGGVLRGYFQFALNRFSSEWKSYLSIAPSWRH